MKNFVCAILLVSATIFCGCGQKTFTIAPINASSINYSEKTSADSFAIIDQRAEEDKQFSTGTLQAVLENIENEILYLGTNVEQLLKKRGIVLNYDINGKSDLKLNVHKFRIRNHRHSGYTPYYTFTTFSADLIDQDKTTRITAYFKNGKVPVWAFREVEHPCYNIPISLVIKEIASKINQARYNLSASDQVVKDLADDIKNNFNDDSYFKVLELGYTNNPSAIPYLVELTEHSDTMVVACALSSLGMLKAKDQIDLMILKYRESKNTKKFMALKAIGDLQTDASRNFLESVKNSDEYRDFYIKEIIDLYL